MLETTFIGHQGWMFATQGARILVDPLLVEPFGHGGGVGVMWPPRQLDLATIPPVDAVIFSHEHEDHFNIPTVNRLSRSIALFMPERSSSAMRQILEEMGFKVNLLSPGKPVEINGELRVTGFAPDHTRHDEQDEWETTPYLVEDMKDGGSFFSPVDVTVSEAIEQQLRQRGLKPGLWGYANNVLNLSFQEQPQRPAPAVEPIIARFVAEHRRRPPPPHASLMCGGGFAFTGSRAWMNHVVFPLDSDQLFEGLQAVNTKERFIVPPPGMQILTDRDGIREVRKSAPFLTTLPKEKWPNRAYSPAAVKPETVEPASGRAELKAGELEELRERLGDFAQFLYGTSLFRALYSLTGTAAKPKFAINAMSGDADHVFEYDPAGCRFVALEKPAPITDYVTGMECFASDLLDFLRGRLAPSALMFGRLLRRRGGEENLTQAIDLAIWMYGHPLRRQAQYLELYRSIYAREPKDVARVAGRISKRDRLKLSN